MICTARTLGIVLCITSWPTQHLESSEKQHLPRSQSSNKKKIKMGKDDMHMEITERCDSVSDFVSPMWKKGKSRKQRSKKMAAPVRPFSVIGSSNPQELHVDLPKRPETSFYKIETNFLMTSSGDGDGEGVSMLDFVDDEGPLSPTEHPRYLSGSHLSQFYGLKTHQIHSRVPHWRRHIEAQVKPVNGEHSTMKIVETTEKWLCLYEELYKATI